MDEMNQLYSYHVFLFPFQWKYTGNVFRDKTLEERTKLDFFIKLLNGTQWKNEPFTIDSRLKYNEVNYFYDFVRDIMFDTEKKQQRNQYDKFIAHFNYDIPSDTLHYSIHLKDKTYHLLIDSIILHLYNTGIGVLSFHLNNRNPEQKEPDDILKINQYGRRIYPPFFGLEMEITGTADQFLPGFFSEGIELVRGKEIDKGISISPFETDGYLEYASKNDFDDGVFLIPGFLKELFKGIPLTTSTRVENEPKNQIHLAPVMDDRMFVLCWYGNDEISKSLISNTVLKDKKKEGEVKEPFEDWFYQYLFIDGGWRTCQNDLMTKELLTLHSNLRWLNYRTFFGASRYSFVCLTSSLDTLKNDNAAFLVNHMQTMYYKIAELCLVQRACILRFSDEVTHISGLSEKNEKELSFKVSSLYKQYIRFVNKIYFREITAQEQGIELYDLLQEKMKLKDQVKDLDEEIEELHNYVLLREQREESKLITRLTRLSAIFLPASVVAGIFGMNTFSVFNDNDIDLEFPWFFWISLFIIGLSSIVVWMIFLTKILRKKS